MKSFSNPVPNPGDDLIMPLKKNDHLPVIILVILLTIGRFPAIEAHTKDGSPVPACCCCSINAGATAVDAVLPDHLFPEHPGTFHENIVIGQNSGTDAPSFSDVYNTIFFPAYRDKVQSSTEGCTLSFDGATKPLVFMDCDGSGTESGEWPAPVILVGEGCGPITLLQTAGPIPGIEIPIGKYEITYTAMAVDKKSGEIIRINQTFFVETQKDLEPPSIKNMPAQVFKKGDKIPDFSKIAETSDNCTARAKLRFEQQPATGTPFDGATKSIKLTASDASGNQAVLNIGINESN